MKEHQSFPWDHFSDQPRVLRDKKLKRNIYIRSSWQMLKSGLLLFILPFFLLVRLFRKSWQSKKVDRCIGVCVHVETECEGKTIVPLEVVKELVDDLNVNQILVRIPLSDSENIESYIEHIEMLSGGDREIAVHLIQNRLVLDDRVELIKALHDIMNRLKGKVEYIHVGSAYNRRKWAFYHFGEYFKFFQVIRSVCREVAPEMKLIGGSVIDFEIPPLLESLFHLRRGHYDGYGLQLYVDRRGAPENTQSGFNFLNKVNLIAIMRQFSWKAKGGLWISEMNWPLRDSGKFSPCKGRALVDEQTQADYLTRSYLLAIASGRVRTCYWHQLVAPGYGLVDNRGESVIRRPSYEALKTLNLLLSGAEVSHFNNGDYCSKKGLYSIELSKVSDGNAITIQAFWSNSGEHQIEFTKANRWINQSGETIEFENSSEIPVSNSVIYAEISEG